MEEITTMNETTETTDAFLSGWDETETPTTEDDSSTVEDVAEAEESVDSTEEAENGEEQKTEENTTQETVAEPEPIKQWELNVLGTKKTMTVDEITPELLQKGYDYDRIHAKLDETKPVMAVFTKASKEAGMSMTEYLNFVRTQMHKANGLSDDEIKRTIDLEDRESAIAEKEESNKAIESAKESADAKMKADLEEFGKAFPDVMQKAKSDKEAIPKEVWDEVNKGMSLTSAYARYAVSKAKEKQAEAEQLAKATEQNVVNANRTTGSMKSAGDSKKSNDPFLEGWDS